MRILFAGSPGIAVPSLQALGERQLAGENLEIVGVLTKPDSPRGRKGRPEPTEVGCAAALLSEKLQSQGYPPILQLKPEKLTAEVREAAAGLKPDILVCFAYGKIFGPQFLALFPLGGINVHPSLLPQYRGATPIPAAILNRAAETGITIQTLGLEMDAGDMLMQERFPLNGRETTASLSALAAQKAGVLLPAVLQGLAQGTLQGTPQRHEDASFCPRIMKEDGRINWSLKVEDIDARIRAFTPWPLAWTFHGEQALYILEGAPSRKLQETAAVPGTVLGTDKSEGILVQTGKGILGITRLQYQAKKALPWQDFLNGARNLIQLIS